MNILNQAGKGLYIWRPSGNRSRLHMHTPKRESGPSNDDIGLAEQFVDAITRATGVTGDVRINTDRCNLLWQHAGVYAVANWLLAQPEYVSGLTIVRHAALRERVKVQDALAAKEVREALYFNLDDGRTLQSQAAKVGFLSARDGFDCMYCRSPLLEPQVEHLIPYSWTNAEPQSTDPGDYVLSCAQCNGEKSAWTEVQYMASLSDPAARSVLGIQ